MRNTTRERIQAAIENGHGRVTVRELAEYINETSPTHKAETGEAASMIGVGRGSIKARGKTRYSTINVYRRDDGRWVHEYETGEPWTVAEFARSLRYRGII